jgi:hypothetical protein
VLRPRLYLCSTRLSFSLSFCICVPLAHFTTTTRLLRLLLLSWYLAVMSWHVASYTTCLLWLTFPHFPTRHHYLYCESPLVFLARVSQFCCHISDLFCYLHVSLMRTSQLISITHWCLLIRLLYYLDSFWLFTTCSYWLTCIVYKTCCKGHSLFRLGLLHNPRTINPS